VTRTENVDEMGHAIAALRGLEMSIRGAESIADEGERNALQKLARDAVDNFERILGRLETSEPAAA
jgi:hypothetical protein